MIRLYKPLVLLCIVVFPFNLFSQVVINEYSCANSTTVLDSYGENEDWIELYNTTGVAVDLNGYHLSDKFGNITKFQIPSSISVPANGYLMIFCSARETINGGEIHTNFKLTQTKNEKIILTNVGVVVDSLTILSTQNNHSRGRTTDGAGTWNIFSTPTPNASNFGAISEYATTPNLSVDAGFYSGTQLVVMATPDANVTIRYTTDGSEPTAGSLAYSDAINVATTTVLRARCFSATAGVPESFIETNTYFINSTHTVPVISISGDDIETLLNGTQLEPIGAIEYFNTAGVMTTEGQGDFNKHGNDSWAYDQRGVDFIMRDQHGYNHSLKEQLFANKSRDRFQRIILKAGASDNYPFEGSADANYAGELGGIHLRDPYVNALSQDGDLYLDERTHQSCILYANGEYWGVYEIREKVDDSDFTDFYYGQDELWSGSPNNIQFLKTWGGTWEKYGAPNAQNDWDNLVNYVQTNSMAVQANFDYVTSQYKWKSLVDYFVLNSYIVSHDMLNYNTAWWRGLDTNGTKKKWRYTLWDMDATFNHYTNYTGIPNTGSAADPCDIDNLPDPGGQGHTTILNALLDNPAFEQYYISRYIDLSNTTFKCTNMITVLDSLVNIIAPEMPGQIARWGGTMAEWNQNVQDMRDFINARCININQGLEDCYGVDGPYPMAYNVFPVGAGDIQINSITPSNYSFNGDYFGNIDILINATENTGYVFDHWEVFNHTLDSSMTNPNNSLQITQGDSVVAHFVIIEDTVSLTFDVDPVGGGDLSINGFTPATYSYSNFYPEASVLNLVATPAPGYTFVNWSSSSTPFNLLATDSNVTVTVDQIDTIIAHFDAIEMFYVAFNVAVPGGGSISIDGVSIPDSYNDNYIENTVLNLVATPAPGYVFVNWTAANGTPFMVSPADVNVSVTINQTDSLVANFILIEYFDIEFKVSPIAMGEVEIDTNFVFQETTTTSVIKTYLAGTSVFLTETPISTYLFDHWGTNFHSLTPSLANSGVSFVVSGNDVVTAYYIEEVIPPPKTAQLPDAFSPNGDGNNDLLFVYGGQIEKIVFDVYNRWGEKVFSSSSVSDGWDGNFKGEKATTGVYVYLLKAVFTDGSILDSSGNVTLVR